jgi:hypothetical protein
LVGVDVELDEVSVGVGDVDALAYPMVQGHVDDDAVGGECLLNVSQVLE